MTPRHIMVTGAAGGIGLACAQAFAATGDRVTGVDARPRELEAAMARVAHEHGVDTAALALDLSDPECGTAVHTAAERLGPVDVLVNAAGLYPATPLSEMTADAWDRVQHVNVRAPVLLAIALAAQGGGSRCVVNIGSRSGHPGQARSRALLHLQGGPGDGHQGVRSGVADAGVRVNAVAPGFIEVNSPVNPVTDDYAGAVSVNPLGRVGQPAEIAAAVLWLASDAASFTTGAVLRVDGGSTAGTTALPHHFPTTTALQRAGKE